MIAYGNNPNRSEAAKQLAQKCFAHLALEESFLRTIIDSSQRTRNALLSADVTAATACLEQQGAISVQRDEFARKREALREEISVQTGVSREKVALQDLIDRLPPSASQPLAEQRDRLRTLARQADETNRGNATLVCYSLEFLRQLLVMITGGTDSGRRYGPAGAVQEAGCGVIVSVQG
jgi:hypothetical protein